MLLETVRNGGAGAYAAAFFAALGALIGLTAIITMFFSRRAARWVGSIALVVSAVTASLGVVGMQMGLRQTDRALELSRGAAGANVTATTRERIRVEGFNEAQCAAKVGLGASAAFALGAIAAIVGAASTRKWALPISTMMLALVSIAGVAMASRESPHAKYPFDPRDVVSWDLVDARAAVDQDAKAGCDDLDHALDEARQSSIDPTPVVSDWRVVATRCAREIFEEVRASGGEVTRPARTSQSQPRTWNAEALLDSPLVVDDELRREITLYAHTTFL